MKISYKVLKRYISNIKIAKEVARDLVMHTAEVEEIIEKGENLCDVFVGEVLECVKHTDSEKLNICKVKVKGEELQIVCGAPNVKAGIKVPVAMVGAKLTPDFEIKKTKIRGETSCGMICSEDELGLVKERQTGILILPDDVKLDTCIKDYLGLDGCTLVIDNKAINHRPDLFSHIGIIREIKAINGESFDFNYELKDFSKLPSLNIKNEIPESVKRYIGLKVENVENIDSPEYIKDVLESAEVSSKGLLIDITNYSLYLYGQPTHCFDADKIEGYITIRKAKVGEVFLALDGKEYKLTTDDIVIADDVKILALGGIIGGLESAVSNTTKNIIIEGAHFDQAIIRKTGKRLGVRTDSLNVFEKDILADMAICGVSLIVSELEKNLGKNIKTTAFSDLYNDKQKEVIVPFDLNYINNLIGKQYSEKECLEILNNLGIELIKNTQKQEVQGRNIFLEGVYNKVNDGEKNISDDEIRSFSGFLKVPFWRKDILNRSDIAEEIARIDGYDNIEATVPRINIGAVVQSNTYLLKNDARNFFTARGFYDMYTYSFVNEDLMKKTGADTSFLVGLKNSLSEELSHMRGSLIPNLLLSLEKNIKEYKDLKLFEFEKVFAKTIGKDVVENYELSGVITSSNDLVYYEIQSIVSDFFKTVGIDNYTFDNSEYVPTYAHRGRTASIIIRGIRVGYVGEIHPKIANNFDLDCRVGFFEINIHRIKDLVYKITKAKEISSFQENNFDLSFVVDKGVKGKDIYLTILKANTELINKVDLFDIYENEEKLPGKRSLSFKIFIQSLNGTLDDKVKNELINDIIKKVEKKGGYLR